MPGAAADHGSRCLRDDPPHRVGPPGPSPAPRALTTGTEADELVELYQRTATHLSLLQSSAPDPMLTARLTQLVARARATVTGTRRASWRDATRFLTAGFPAAVYRSRHWWIPTAVLSTVLAAVIGWWIGTHPEVQSAIAAPDDLRRLTSPGGEYETYYSSHPAASFAAQVWTNNAQAAAMCLVLGAFLGIPVIWILFLNVLNVGVGIGLMSSAGRLDTFLGLILPHGLLELTAVFVAAGTGLRLGWTVIDPGPLVSARPSRSRAEPRSAWPSVWRWSSSSPASSKASSPPPAFPPGDASPSASWPSWSSSATSTSWAAEPREPVTAATSIPRNAVPSFRSQPDVRTTPLTC